MRLGTKLVGITAAVAAAIGLTGATSPTVYRLAAGNMAGSYPTGDCTSAGNTCSPTEQSLTRRPESPVLVPASSAPMSRASALAAATSLGSIVRRVDRSAAKLTTWGQFQTAEGNASTLTSASGFTPGQQVWIVAVAGEIHPSFDRFDRIFSWAVFVFDKATGGALSTAAGPTGTWPPYFDSIVDEAD